MLPPCRLPATVWSYQGFDALVFVPFPSIVYKYRVNIYARVEASSYSIWPFAGRIVSSLWLPCLQLENSAWDSPLWLSFLLSLRSRILIPFWLVLAYHLLWELWLERAYVELCIHLKGVGLSCYIFQMKKKQLKRKTVSHKGHNVDCSSLSLQATYNLGVHRSCRLIEIHMTLKPFCSRQGCSGQAWPGHCWQHSRWVRLQSCYNCFFQCQAAFNMGLNLAPQRIVISSSSRFEADTCSICHICDLLALSLT